MAETRKVKMCFWNDTKVIEFTPEERYFYLYLLTNPHTNLIGCYELSLTTISRETGYTKEVCENILKRFVECYHVIEYAKDTKEVLLVKWLYHNFSKSEKTQAAMLKDIKKVKSDKFRNFFNNFLNRENVIEVKSVEPKKTKYSEDVLEIVAYMNMVFDTHYRAQTKATREHIIARLKEGFTVDDFKAVIDKKFKQWGNDSKMSLYLRPQTLFSGKFESYLNEVGNVRGKQKTSQFDELRSIAEGGFYDS